MLLDMLRECDPEATVMLFDEGNFVEAFAACEERNKKTVTLVDINVYENLYDINQGDDEDED